MKKIGKIVGILGVLSVLIGICSLVLTAIPCDLYLIKILLTDWKIVLMNAWPILGVMIVLYCIMNSVGWSFLITSILVFVIAEVNRFKMAFRDDPFVFSDIFLVEEAKDMVGNYKLYLDKVSVCAIFFIVITTIICFWACKMKLGNKLIRISGIALSCVLLILSVNLLYFGANIIYKSTWHEEFGNQWKSGNQYMSRGVVYSFVRSISDAMILSPDGYNEKEVKEILDNYETADMSEDSKVHMISIMLEAYNDFSVFDGVEFVEDPYQTFHDMQEQSYSGQLYTDIFAAGTIKTERSFLTGYSDTDFYDRDVESYVRYLKSQGYYTEAMHPCYGWFYDRRYVNEYLGFDNFEYYENRYAYIAESDLKESLYQNLISDMDFFDYIIEGYERAVANGEKYFNFSVTYQNHGPYSTEQETEIEYALKKEQYTEDEYHIFNNYLAGIARTDRALGKLRDYVDSQEEPIVLILFGDHNPWLGENNSVYEMLGIDLDLDTAKGAENYYVTPYVFYANEAAKAQLQKEFVGQGNTVSPMFLMNEYFEYVGIKGPAYLNYLQTVKEEFSVINTAYAKQGEEYILREKLKENEVLTNQAWVEYYMKTKKVSAK